MSHASMARQDIGTGPAALRDEGAAHDRYHAWCAGAFLQQAECQAHVPITLAERSFGFIAAELGGWLARTFLDDIGHDALAVDRAPRGREVARGRQLDGASARERQHRLDRALAV